MAISLVTSVTAGPGSGGGATSAIDTTGATLLVISASWWGNSSHPVSFSDSKGNTWTQVTYQGSGTGNDMRHQFAYCLNPTVGAGHTFSVTGTSVYPAIIVYAFSGTTGYDYQTRSGAGGSVASLATGSVTPVADNALILTGLIVNNSVLPTGLAVAPAGFALTTKQGVSGVCFPGAAAYLVQTPAGAINPTWSWSGTFEAAASTIVFSTGLVADIRLTNVYAEALTQNPIADVRLTGACAEVLTQNPTADVRVTSASLDALTQNLTAAIHLTSESVEVLSTTAAAGADVRLTQAYVEVLGGPFPVVRVTQLFAEALTQDPPVPGQVSQLPVEIGVVLPSTPARLTQGAVEFLSTRPPAPALLTQAAVETSHDRLTGDASAWLTQAPLEICYPFGCYEPPSPPCVTADFVVDTVDPGGSCETPPPEETFDWEWD